MISPHKSDSSEPLSEDLSSVDDEAQADNTLHVPDIEKNSRPSSRMSRSSSFNSNQSFDDDETPPLEKLTIFDFLGNLDLPHKLEKWQHTLNNQRDLVKKQQERIKSTGIHAKDRVVGEWRKHSSEEQLEKYRQRMKDGVEKLGARWIEMTTVSAREKVSFVLGSLNIFISGYLIGAHPAYFYYWYTLQLLFLMPIRFFTYKRIGYHYFIADLCYFVNLLTILTIWVFPHSKRLFISTWCLAFGNNAVAIALWRNSLVFHSLDKVTSVMIHLMPPVTLHCLAHLTTPTFLLEEFPAIYDIKYSRPGDPQHYSLGAMMVWATVPYAVWQLAYHFLINVRRHDKIAAGRPTSFTWMRKSYRKTWIGHAVLSLPDYLQEPTFMLIQYLYAILTIIPCPIWFWYHHASSFFVFGVFAWSIYNGSTYYIDVFGKRFQRELEQLKHEMAQWQNENGSFDSNSSTLAPVSFDSSIEPANYERESGRKNSDHEGNANEFELVPSRAASEAPSSGNDGGNPNSRVQAVSTGIDSENPVRVQARS